MEQRSGEVLERGGSFHVRIRLTGGKRFKKRVTCETRRDAERRCEVMVRVASMLIEHEKPQLLEKALERIARAPDERAVEGFRKAVAALCSGAVESRNSNSASLTFRELAEDWTSGRLCDQYPDDIARKDWSDDRSRLRRHILPVIGDVPVNAIAMDHIHEVMRSLPRDMEPATRRHVQQVMVRLMNISAYPLQLVKVSPIPKGFLIKLRKNRKAKSFLYPDEERRLLGCTAVPLVYRVLWGVMGREGPRVSEFLGNRRKEVPPCTWRMFDLESGMLINDWNKTDDPRAWVMNSSVVAALSRWKARYHPHAERDSLVFTEDDGRPLNPDRLAERFRSHLREAGVNRPELFEHHEKRLRVRVHDLRATFVTLSLARGKSERWVMARTGHTSSEMISRYDRAARSAAEANMTELHPMDECIPELRDDQAASRTGPNGRAATETRDRAAPSGAPSPMTHVGLLETLSGGLQNAVAAGDQRLALALVDAVKALASRS